MKIRNRLAALMGAGALVFAVAGTALAATDNVDWTGNGLTDGHLTDSQCDLNNTPFLYWVLSPAGTITAAELWINGVDVGAMTQSQEQGNPAWKLVTGFYDLDTLEASAAVTFTGSLSEGTKLKISHGCTGETSSQPPSEGPSFSLDTGGETDSPSEPSTDGIGNARTSSPADGAWLLVVALGVLLASVVVLTPARAKGKR